MENLKQFDVIIIGGSYAGMATALGLGRALRNVLVIDDNNPCNKQTPHSHNFLTNDGKSPQQIAMLARQNIARYKTVTFMDARAISAAKSADGFNVVVTGGKSFSGKKLVLATGIKDVLSNIPGFAESWGISVLHCPYCHGYEVRNQITGILGNGESGYEMASLISNWTNDLTLFTNGPALFDASQHSKLKKHNITIVESEVLHIEQQKGMIKGVFLKNGELMNIDTLYTRPPFIQHSDTYQQLRCELSHDGYIKIDASHKTTIPGIFACGDNTTRMRTVANAIAQGTTTAIMVNKELIEDTF